MDEVTGLLHMLRNRVAYQQTDLALDTVEDILRKLVEQIKELEERIDRIGRTGKPRTLTGE